MHVLFQSLVSFLLFTAGPGGLAAPSPYKLLTNSYPLSVRFVQASSPSLTLVLSPLPVGSAVHLFSVRGYLFLVRILQGRPHVRVNIYIITKTDSFLTSTLVGPREGMEAHFQKMTADRQASRSLLARTKWERPYGLRQPQRTNTHNRAAVLKYTRPLSRPLQANSLQQGPPRSLRKFQLFIVLWRWAILTECHCRRPSNVHTFRCTEPSCSRTFSRRQDLERHKKEQHGPERWFCVYPDCHYKMSWDGTPRKDTAERHLRTQHGERQHSLYLVRRRP